MSLNIVTILSKFKIIGYHGIHIKTFNTPAQSIFNINQF